MGLSPVDMRTEPRISVVIPAAGASARMCGIDKLLCKVGGMPLIRRLALEALHSKAFEVIVAVRPDQPERKSALAELDLRVTEVVDADRGMSESLKCGLAAVRPESCGALVLLPDMPGITSRHINLMIEGFTPGRVVQACDRQCAPGNPVILPRRLFGAVRQLTGDAGARRLIARGGDGPIAVELPGNVSRTDLDTPEDWARWRAGLEPAIGAGGGI